MRVVPLPLTLSPKEGGGTRACVTRRQPPRTVALALPASGRVAEGRERGQPRLAAWATTCYTCAMLFLSPATPARWRSGARRRAAGAWSEDRR